MLTLFTTPKPFQGHEAIIQRNAITSWTLLRPTPEIILLGSEPGAAELAADLKLVHIPEVARSELGTPLLGDLFARAETAASTDVLAWVNADIILMDDFAEAARDVLAWNRGAGPFLMSGGRWDVGIAEPLDFDVEWQAALRSRVRRDGSSRGLTGIDYFVFPRHTFPDLAPLGVGRSWLDHWLIWKARSLGIPVIDSTERVLAVHQLHGYAHLGVETSEEVSSRRPANADVRRNLAATRGQRKTLEDATHILSKSGVRPLRLRPLWLRGRRTMRHAWFAVLDATRPVRAALGLRRRRAIRGSAQRDRKESFHGVD